MNDIHRDKEDGKSADQEAGTTLVQETDGSPEAIHAAMLKGLLPLADEMIDVSTGRIKGFSSSNNFAIKEGWEFLKDVIRDAGAAQKINAENTADVINLLSEGKLSISDAKELMNMLSLKSDIEDIKILLQRVNQLTDNT